MSKKENDNQVPKTDASKTPEATPKLKLNTKRTMYIGMAFFTIMMLWQVYNTYCPLFLTDYFTNTLHLYDGNAEKCSYIVGIIMAMDNIFALFMIPLFGMWSDKTNTKLGKRMPFILVGIIASVVLFPLIPITFINGNVPVMIVIMALILIFMNVYRNPAVSLMPDITPKPLRSKANAIINVIGYVGAIFAGILAMIFTAKENEAGVLVYDENTIWIPFALTAVLMIVALVVLLCKIKENKIAKEMKEQMELGEKMSETSEQIVEDKPLSKKDKTNLVVLLVAIFLWFFAFNAIETFGSTYGVKVLEQSSSWWGGAVIVMTICSLLGFFPGAWIADKAGRRNTVLIGLVIMVVSLGVASILAFTMGTSLAWLYYILIGIAGVGWAWINVNSYPMVVEMASKRNIGKLTGWYYAASMLAQSITPICIGFLFGVLGYKFLFPYAMLFVLVALVVFLFYRPQKHDKK